MALRANWGFAMAFASYLADFDVDAETNRVLDVALEVTRAALGLADDFANGIIARQIVEVARTGERNPDLLCEGALKNRWGIVRRLMRHCVGRALARFAYSDAKSRRT